MDIIDPHLHFFNLELGEYHWLKSDNPPLWSDKSIIARNFTAADLVVNANLSLSAVVHIEAGFNNEQPWRETHWLESSVFCQRRQAQNAPWQIKGNSIACVNLSSTTYEFEQLIHKLLSYSCVIGVRHILDQEAVSLLSDQQVQKNLAYLAQSNLIFECQFNAANSKAVDYLCRQLKQTPTLKVVINHAGFPAPKQSSFSTWQSNMAKLASFDQVFIKASGWEMVDRQYQSSDIALVVRQLINLFGFTKVMLASNFPLCLFSCSYANLWQSYLELALEPQEREHLMYLNAKRIYAL